jgi:hypothetical protein
LHPEVDRETVFFSEILSFNADDEIFDVVNRCILGEALAAKRWNFSVVF